MEQRKRFNAVGGIVRKLRNNAGLTQEALTAKCNVAGCDISRGTLAKIEARVRCITDIELYTIAKILKVRMEDLFPTGFASRSKRGW